MTQESWHECLRLLGIKNLQPTLPQWEFLRASCPDLLKRHPDKRWWMENKLSLREELLDILEEFDPVIYEK